MEKESRNMIKVEMNKGNMKKNVKGVKKGYRVLMKKD